MKQQPLKLLFDARFIAPQMTGVGYCTERLLMALRERHSDIELHVVYHDPIDPSLLDRNSIRAPVRFDDHPAGDFWRNLSLPRIMAARKIDLYHGPAFYGIQRNLNIPQMITIHDMAVYDRPDTFSHRFAWYFRKVIASACKRATLLVTSTRFVAGQIEQRFPNTRNRISVVPYGVAPEFRETDPAASSEFKLQWSLPDRYILDVATIEPRKNILTLLNAYAIYRRRCITPLPLIIAGKDGYQAEMVKRRAREADIEGAVRFLGYVSNSDIAHLYRLATMLVFPSLYEGFGLPILEAMAGGCPVIASNVTSLPEVCGDAASLIDPMSTTAISNAMLMLTDHENIRQDLIARGLRHVAGLTWSDVADRTTHLYRSCVQGKGTT